MADNVGVTPGIGVNIATDDVSGVQYQRVKRSVGIDGSATDFLDAPSRQDTFTATGNGTTFNVSAQGVSSFALQVKGTGAAPTSWTVNLQVSLDGVNFYTVLTHTNSGSAEDPRTDGQIIFTAANHYPSLYFRSNVSQLTLGSATNIVVTICAK